MKEPAIVCGDFNAHSQIWDHNYPIDNRGEETLDWIIENNLSETKVASLQWIKMVRINILTWMRRWVLCIQEVLTKLTRLTCYQHSYPVQMNKQTNPCLWTHNTKTGYKLFHWTTDQSMSFNTQHKNWVQTNHTGKCRSDYPTKFSPFF